MVKCIGLSQAVKQEHVHALNQLAATARDPPYGPERTKKEACVDKTSHTRFDYECYRGRGEDLATLTQPLRSRLSTL